MSAPSMAYIGGKDWPVSTTPVTYTPRQIPKGLDWASITPPPTPPELAATIRARAPKSRGPKRRRHTGPRTLTDAQQIIDSYVAGMPVARLAKTHNHAGRTINRVLAAAGVQLRDDQRRKRPRIVGTPELLARIRHDYEVDRLRVTDIAATLGYAPSTVRRLMAEGGIASRCAPRRPRTKVTADVVAAVVALYGEGFTQTRIADQLCMAKSTVSRIVRVEIPTHPGRIRGAKHALNPATIIDRYLAGQAVRAIADDHGTTPNTIRKILTDRGVPLRDDRARNGKRRIA